MNIISLVIGFVLGAAIALGAYILIRRSVLKGKREEILEKAELEGQKIKNERILQAKRRPSMRKTPRSGKRKTA